MNKLENIKRTLAKLFRKKEREKNFKVTFKRKYKETRSLLGTKEIINNKYQQQKKGKCFIVRTVLYNHVN